MLECKVSQLGKSSVKRDVDVTSNLKTKSHLIVIHKSKIQQTRGKARQQLLL